MWSLRYYSHRVTKSHSVILWRASQKHFVVCNSKWFAEFHTCITGPWLYLVSQTASPPAYVQLTTEYHGFELHGSTYTQIKNKSINTVDPSYPRGSQMWIQPTVNLKRVFLPSQQQIPKSRYQLLIKNAVWIACGWICGCRWLL